MKNQEVDIIENLIMTITIIEVAEVMVVNMEPAEVAMMTSKMSRMSIEVAPEMTEQQQKNSTVINLDLQDCQEEEDLLLHQNKEAVVIRMVALVLILQNLLLII